MFKVPRKKCHEHPYTRFGFYLSVKLLSLRFDGLDQVQYRDVGGCSDINVLLINCVSNHLYGYCQLQLSIASSKKTQKFSAFRIYAQLRIIIYIT